MHRRAATQFHWFNEGFGCFEDFLATFNSRKRKALNKERRRVAEQGLVLKTLTGPDIGTREWEQFYHFYQLTYAKRSGHGGYLSREFFVDTAAGMGDQVVMVLAYLDAHAVAGALYFRSSDTLYGRYWGCAREYDCLHFEACYYQGIEYCIANKLARFDPGRPGRTQNPTRLSPHHHLVESLDCGFAPVGGRGRFHAPRSTPQRRVPAGGGAHATVQG